MYTNHSKKNNKGGARGGLFLRLVVISFLVVLPLLPAYTVSAQCGEPPCPTETATPPPPPTATPRYGSTIENPFNSTPQPTDLPNGICPTGFLDPNRAVSMEWLKRCSQCIPDTSNIPTLVPQPTFSWEDFINATAAPAFTPTPAATTTPTPGETGVESRSTFGGEQYTPWIDEIIPPDTPISRYKAMILGSGNMNTGYKWYITDPNKLEQVIGVHITGEYDITSIKEDYIGDYSYLAFRFDRAGGFHTAQKIEIVSSNISEIVVGAIYEGEGSSTFLSEPIPLGHQHVKTFDIAFNITLIREYSWTDTHKPAAISTFVTGASERGDVNWTVEWNYGPVVLPDLGYCSEFVYGDNGEGGDGSANKPIVDIPSMNIWQGQCIDFIPPFDWSRDGASSFLFDIDFSFPGIGICPVYLEMEPLEIADIEIPFEIMIIPAVMWVFSLIWKL